MEFRVLPSLTISLYAFAFSACTSLFPSILRPPFNMPSSSNWFRISSLPLLSVLGISRHLLIKSNSTVLLHIIVVICQTSTHYVDVYRIMPLDFVLFSLETVLFYSNSWSDFFVACISALFTFLYTNRPTVSSILNKESHDCLLF